MYTAIVLDENQRQKLLKQLFNNYLYPPEGWVLLAHQITINMGPMDKKLNPSALEMLGSRCTATVRDVLHRRNYGIFVVGVVDLYCEDSRTPIKSANKYPHITIAHAPQVRPSYVNSFPDMRSWQIIPNLNGLTVEGTLSQITHAKAFNTVTV